MPISDAKRFPMQPPKDPSHLNNISCLQRCEREIEAYSGDDPLNVWEKNIEWATKLDERACFNLMTRCINRFKNEKRYHNDWRFVKICILRVLKCKDKNVACRRLHSLGIGKTEGRFYVFWANSCMSQGEMDEAGLIFEMGLEMSNSHIDELKVSYNMFLEGSRKKSHQKEENRKEVIVLGSINIEDLENHCVEELMAKRWYDGKHRSRRFSKKSDFREIKKKSTFGLALENIREEAESYQTNNSTLSPVKKLIFGDEFMNEQEASALMSEPSIPSDMPPPVHSGQQTSRLVDYKFSHHQVPQEDGVDDDDDDDYEDDMTKHTKYAKTYLEGLFFGSSEPDKTLAEAAEEKVEEPLFVYEDPMPQNCFKIYEDSETSLSKGETQKAPVVNLSEDVENKGNADVVQSKSLALEHESYKVANVELTPQERSNRVKSINQQEDMSFFSTSAINIVQSQADKSISNFQEFSKGLEPGKTSTQNVTNIFKSFVKSKGAFNYLQTLDEFMDLSKESFRHEHQEEGSAHISLCDDNKKLAVPHFLADFCAPHNISHSSFQEIEKSLPDHSKRHHIEDCKLDNTLTSKPYDMSIDDDHFHCVPSFLQLSAAGSQNFMQPEKTLTRDVAEPVDDKGSTSHSFIAAYEAPMNDQSGEEMKVSKSNSRWRRCSVLSIVTPLVTNLNDTTIGEVDFNLSCVAENRTNHVDEELAPTTFSTSFVDASILIDTENPYNEESIRSFIAHLKPPLSKYPGYQEMNRQRMPAFKIGSVVALGTKTFSVKKILGEGAYAKAYHLSCVGQGMENKKDCVAKLQRPSCPWEFYITRELKKRLRELIEEEQFINVIPSVMNITEAYFFDDGSLFLNEMHDYGTLLDLINLQKCKMIELPQWFVLMLCYELVCLVDAMHRCSMIHGDLKPDNVLLRQLPLLKDDDSIVCLLKSKTNFLKLIDFGQSIDMAMYPCRTEFTSKSKKKDFQCTEMKMGKSWSYHIDLYFLAGIMYVLMMGSYMNPSMVAANKWSAHVKLKRSWKHEDRIREFIDMLINIESVDKMPDLSIISAWLLSAIDVKTDIYNAFIRQLLSILNK